MQLLIRLIADGTLVIVLLVAAVVTLRELRRTGWRSVPTIIMAGLTSLLIGKLLSLVYQPAYARPFLELGVSPGAAYIDNPGFPSDHALLATAATLAVYALTRSRRLLWLLVLLVVMMSGGRVAALVHTPLDVLGGILAGASGALWYKKLTNSKKRSTISL